MTLAVADIIEPATPSVAPEDTVESVLAGVPAVHPGGRWVDALAALTGG